ncbi:MAG: arginine--tRNA ligase [Oscillospiraceae bacterium]|jgi:arginyl-tRNA synthetase|nr:arginine--tRNA ligase [Oscillospiraceae bacterium]
MHIKTRIAAQISQSLTTLYGQEALDPAAVAALLETPPDPAMGDCAFPCFTLARTLRKAPPMIAQALAEAIGNRGFAQTRATGGYLNFFLNLRQLAEDTVPAVLANPGRWGASDLGAGKTVCLDYSSINIAKRFHIGHLTTTMLGHALRRIYTHLGYTAVGINHLGDWGTQFGKMICAFLRWGSKQEVEQGGVGALVDLYVRFHGEVENDPTLEDEGRAWFKRIEDGDPQALAIFNWFKDLTLRDAQRVYDLLGVSFDSYAGESFYNDKMDRVVDELRAKGLLVESQGAWVVDLSAYKMPPCIILKKDGATLYATRDIAAALYRKDTYGFAKSLYIVAYQQDLHFKQVFKTIELMGYPWYQELEHVSFGMVSYEGQTLSTRKGHIVYLEDLLQRATEKALAIIEEKSPGLENKREVARQVGIGAVIYADLQNNRIKDVDFWWDRALQFDGETGPYVQYTHARCCAVLRKALDAPAAAPDWASLDDEEARQPLLLLARFPDAVQEAAQRNEPSILTRHTTLLAQAYNKFYYERRILDDNPGTAAARLALTRAVRDVLRTGLYLIGIEAPERM